MVFKTGTNSDVDDFSISFILYEDNVVKEVLLGDDGRIEVREFRTLSDFINGNLMRDIRMFLKLG